MVIKYNKLILQINKTQSNDCHEDFSMTDHLDFEAANFGFIFLNQNVL